jgi:hypothetical protein
MFDNAACGGMRMKLSAAGAFVATGLLAAAAPAAETAPTAATVRPTAVIPLMAKAPKIDGAVAAEEWPTLHVRHFVTQNTDVLEPRHGEFWLGCDGNDLFVAVRSAVHPQAGPKQDRKPRKGLRDVRGLETDDSIELWIDSNTLSNDAEYFLFRLNTLGAQTDVRYRPKYHSERRYWRPLGYRHGQSLDDGTWTVEMAIPLADLKIEAPNTPLGIRVCRNYQRPRDQARWAPGVTLFSDRKTMPRVRFVPKAPVVCELGVQDANGVCIAVGVANPTDEPLGVKVKLAHARGGEGRKESASAATLKPGARRRFELRAPLPGKDDDAALGSILVTAPDDAVYYHRDFKWHTGAEEVWEPVGEE